MGSRELGPILKGFDALFGAGTAAARSDGEILDTFLAGGEAAEVAFARLVERHGPMVLRVCRGELRDAHAAEDAFQATFLILARKARSIRNGGSVASWLYGVARRAARRARAGESRRAETERRGASMARRDLGGDVPIGLVPEIQEEIDGLPAASREAIVLCDLEGLSREEAAGRLGVPASTFRGRLARARKRLRGRLVRRGLAPGAVASALGADAMSAMPATLVDVTIRAAMQVAAGRAALASGPVAALVEGVLKAMFLTKLKTAAAMLAVAATMSLAAVPLLGALTRSPGPERRDSPVAARPEAPIQAPAPPAAKPKTSGREYVIAPVAAMNLARVTNVIGSIVPFESIDLYARSPGVLKTQEVDIGDAVKRGQALATVYVPELIADVEQAKARIVQSKARVDQARTTVVVAEASRRAATAEAEAALAEATAAEATLGYRQKQFDRIGGLIARAAVEPRLGEEAQDRLDEAKAALAAAKAKILTTKAGLDGADAKVAQAKADVAGAEADLRVAEAGLDKAELLVGQSTIASPIDGVVTRRSFHPGDFVRAGDQPGAVPVLTIVRADRVRVVVNVSERDATMLKKGAPATIRLGAGPGRTYDGKVSRMAFALEPNSQTLRVEVDLDNPDGSIHPGQSGIATIDLGARRPRLVIPGSALFIFGDPRSSACYRVEGGRSILTRIAIDRIADDRIEVVEGLKEGDRVITNPDRGLKDGEPVPPEVVAPGLQ